MIALPIGTLPSDRPMTVAIVQARMGSERLPGKMMMDLCGKPLLAHVIDRLKLCETLHQIVVATPDKELALYAQDRGVWGYHDMGDPGNVLLRYIKAAGWSGAQLVVRITGDCPLVDPKVVDDCVSAYINNRVDIVTNVLRRTFPKGMDVEVLHLNTLKRIYHLINDPRYREHVTLYAYENPALFVFKGITQNRDYGWINVSIDTRRDLDKVQKMIPKLEGVYTLVDVVRTYEELYE